MPYQTGAASSPANLISSLDSFLTANGWTRNKLAGSAPAVEYYWQIGDFYIAAETIAGAIKFWISTGFDGAQAINNQPGAPAGGGLSWVNPIAQTPPSDDYVSSGNMYEMTGPYTSHHFFLDSTAGAEQLFCVVETSPAQYRHFGFGRINKNGSGGGTDGYTGGQFLATDGKAQFTGSQSASEHPPALFGSTIGSNRPTWIIRVGLDGTAEQWYDTSQLPSGSNAANVEGASNPGATGTDPLGSSLIPFQEQAMSASYSGITPALDIFPLIGRPAGSTTPSAMSILGTFPVVSLIWMEFIDPGEVITIGANDYLAFPVGIKSESSFSTAPNSWLYGLLYNRDI